MIWPLENEALYYASCAYHKTRLSDPSNLPPYQPALPYEKWANVHEDKLFETINTNVLKAYEKVPEKVSDRQDILSLLEGMSAHGWVGFESNISRELWGLIPTQQRCDAHKFTGNVIIGVVKPFIKKEDWCSDYLQRQLHTMTLMKSLGWGLREYQARNWINSYLVDGADVEVNPSHPHYLHRSWCAAFFQCIIQGKCHD
jgi:hypothetical protein